MRTREKLRIATRLLQNCAGYEDGDEVSQLRKAALDYYFMRARGDETPGRSAVVSGDLSAMTEACLSQMCDALKSPTLGEFPPDGAEDKDQAETESDVVSQLMMGDNNGKVLLHQAIKDALLQMNAFAEITVDDTAYGFPRKREFAKVSPEAFAELTADKPGVRLEHIDYRRGMLTYSEVPTRKKLCWEGVAPESFVYTKNWHSLELERIPCAGVKRVDTRSDLIAVWKFPRETVDELAPHFLEPGSETARNPRGSQRSANKTGDKSLDLIEWYRLYVLVDVDGDGIAERRVMSIVPNKALFEDLAATGVPFPCGAALLNAHRLQGVSLYNKLKQIQDKSTALERAALDNGRAANKSRTVYLEGRVDQADLEDGRVDGNIAVTGSGITDARAAVAALVVPDITPGILAMLQEQRQRRSELGGASLDLATGQAQLTEKLGSQGVDRMYSVMELLAALMADTFANTFIRSSVLIAHRTLREHWDEPITIQRRGKPVTTNPKDWRERTRFTPRLGMSPGERRRKSAALLNCIQWQVGLGKEGMSDILLSAQTLHKLILDWCRVEELPNPEQYWIDPASDPAKQAKASKDEQRSREIKAQQTLTDMALGLEQMRIALDKRNKDADRVLEYFKAVLDAEKTQAQVVGKATADFELARQQADELARDREHETKLADSVGRATETLKSIKGNGSGAAAE